MDNKRIIYLYTYSKLDKKIKVQRIIAEESDDKYVIISGSIFSYVQKESIDEVYGQKGYASVFMTEKDNEKALQLIKKYMYEKSNT